MATGLGKTRIAGEIIIRELGLEKDELAPEKSFIDDLGLDSLDVMTLAMSIEEDFDIEVPDDDVENIKTIQDVTDYLHKRLDG